MGYYNNSHISWSKMRKILEQENICESLKGRVQYFQTSYGSGSQTRIAIRVDKKEVLKSSYYPFWRGVVDIATTERAMTGKTDYNSAVNKMRNQGQDDSFFHSFYQYQNQSIDKSLTDENPFVRLFAIMDRRVGKRTLQKLVHETEKQPAWLQPFYRLRLEADGVLKDKLTKSSQKGK